MQTISEATRQLQGSGELLLVIDHSDALLRRAREAFPDVRVIANEGPGGLSAARNTGVRHAGGDVLVFLDDDAVPDRAWLARLVRTFDAPDVVGAGGAALPAWGIREPRWMPREFLWTVGCSYEGLPPAGAPIRNPIGATMAFRREAFERAGGFREGIGRLGAKPLGCEETEFAIRVRASLPGMRILHVPDARVAHHVDPERASWRYFLARCWAEGRSKAAVTAHVGVSEGLASERSYVARTLPRGFADGLRAAARGELSGLARATAIAAGLLVTTVGYLRGRASPIASAPEARAAFRPIAVHSAELGRPLEDVVAGASSTGAPYGAALVLARLRGEPLGLATVPLSNGRADARDMAERLWSALGEEVRRREPELPIGELGPASLLRGLGLSGTGDSSPAALSMEDPPQVTVIVPTGGRSAQLRRCLDSLRAVRYPRFDVLVVDNRPGDESTRRVVEAQAAADPRIRYSAEPRPGSSVARNHGLVRTTAEIVAFTDDDVVVDPDWLGWLVRPLFDDPSVAVATGLVLPAALETPAQWWFEAYGGFGKGFERREYDLNGNRAGDRLLYPYWGGVFGSGNSMAFRSRSLRSIGGFDPALGAGSMARAGSDIEAFSHVILRGERLVYEPRSVCWHEHRRDERALRRQLLSYGIGMTAILTKWALRHPSLVLSAASELRGRVRRSARGARGGKSGLPKRLQRLELYGYLLGPPLYLRSVLWARRLRLADVMTETARGPSGD